MLGMTLIAVGMGLVYYACQPHKTRWEDIPTVLAFIGGNGLISGGLMNPFKRPWTVAMVVILIESVMALIMLPMD
jgi:hypothetical protein